LKAQLRALARAQERLQASLNEAVNKGGGNLPESRSTLVKIEEMLETVASVQADLREHATATEVFLTRFDKLLCDLDHRVTQLNQPPKTTMLRWTLGLSLIASILFAACLLAFVYSGYFVTN
jgi:hypothetical protein